MTSFRAGWNDLKATLKDTPKPFVRVADFLGRVIIAVTSGVGAYVLNTLWNVYPEVLSLPLAFGVGVCAIVAVSS